MPFGQWRPYRAPFLRRDGGTPSLHCGLPQAVARERAPPTGGRAGARPSRSGTPSLHCVTSGEGPLAVGTSCVRRLRRCLLFSHKFQLFMLPWYGVAWEQRALNDRMSACTPLRSLSRLMDKGNASHFFFMLSPNQRPCTVWRLRRQA